MGTVRIRYWAGAKAAAGTALEEVVADTPRQALDQARRRRADAGFDRVLAASSLLIDGRAAHEEDLDGPVTGSVELEVLPPFAGG
ncbi:MoaD/ThiS family protein [Microlunatus parietis]|uniref:Molybdopterin converting factor small subunit n=1 Tax=Microlunatus parietis TaxID=682979 RepID=A0A7Y9IAS2_9ACTN|nr:MoaD/ThiS family protein [Microlunatus parietis]NYE73240.1 molybdopterin converting factor small subunit [Microlunatus parietis]